MNPNAPIRGDIQALRGLAVLLVLVFHAWPEALPGGFVGVDVFFVISGYLISGLQLREIESDGRIDLPAFYARRLRRLLPVAALVICATVLAFSLTHSRFEAQGLVASALAAALYVSNGPVTLHKRRSRQKDQGPQRVESASSATSESGQS